MKISNIFIGFFILSIGFFNLLANLRIFPSLSNLIWPMLLIIPGIFFQLSYKSNKKNIALLVPGTILTIYGFFFYFNIITNWHFMKTLWPIFPMAIGIGLFNFSVFGKRNYNLLIASKSIIAVSLISMTLLNLKLNLNDIFPPVLIIIGLIIIIKGNV